MCTRMTCRTACLLGRSATASLAKPDPLRMHACERRGKVISFLCDIVCTFRFFNEQLTLCLLFTFSAASQDGQEGDVYDVLVRQAGV